MFNSKHQYCKYMRFIRFYNKLKQQADTFIAYSSHSTFDTLCKQAFQTQGQPFTFEDLQLLKWLQQELIDDKPSTLATVETVKDNEWQKYQLAKSLQEAVQVSGN